MHNPNSCSTDKVHNFRHRTRENELTCSFHPGYCCFQQNMLFSPTWGRPGCLKSDSFSALSEPAHASTSDHHMEEYEQMRIKGPPHQTLDSAQHTTDQSASGPHALLVTHRSKCAAALSCGHRDSIQCWYLNRQLSIQLKYTEHLQVQHDSRDTEGN